MGSYKKREACELGRSLANAAGTSATRAFRVAVVAARTARPINIKTLAPE